VARRDGLLAQLGVLRTQSATGLAHADAEARLAPEVGRTSRPAGADVPPPRGGVRSTLCFR
jgi:hypothetical protein